MARLTLSTTPAAEIKADALVVGVVSGPKGIAFAPGSLPPGSDRTARAALANLLGGIAAVGATGRRGEVVKVPGGAGVAAGLVVAVGLGDAPGRGAGFEPEVLRRAAGEASRSLAGTKRAVFALPTPDPIALDAVAQGALLGAYAFTTYRSTADPAKAPLGSIVLAVATRDAAARRAATRAEAIADGVTLARDLVNTPPSHLHPVELAAAATAALDGLPVSVRVMDEKALARGKFGGIIAVGQGSANPPRLIEMSYQPTGARRHLAIVGKGITFDSGGLSLKTPAGMETMKSDMGGAAAVIGAMTAIARLGLPVRVTGWVPAAENMPSGTAQRPSDVITIYGGRTVEVLNTDAEGRLILADVLVRAAEDEPDVIVDAATLTGAQLVALGSRVSGIMANQDALRDKVFDAATRAGETMWPMPLPDDMRPSLDSAVADIANIGDRMGGMLTAGIFLREFVAADLAWAHLDIAGPAFNESGPYGYTPKGGTGAAVRTFVQLAQDAADGLL